MLRFADQSNDSSRARCSRELLRVRPIMLILVWKSISDAGSFKDEPDLLQSRTPNNTPARIPNDCCGLPRFV